ncbi:MAG: type II secretion system protein M [Lachnospiraceae bacterium]|jgi:hypothetical protein|nr:type II secretion system protein M [Lachnospiraceae bacterium]MCI1726774.1 type II secretion system protein M [Lachnospiraceae bacterium]
MTTNLTERDKKLLFMLGIIGIIAAFFLLGIRPLLSSISKTDSTISEEEAQLAIEKQEAALLPTLKSTNEQMQSNITAATSDFYDRMESDEVDKLLTNLVLSEGLNSRNLVITMPTEEISLDPYLYSAAAKNAGSNSGNDTSDMTDSVTSASDASVSDTADSVSAESETLATEESTAETASSEGQTSSESVSGSGVYAVEASMEVAGDMATCQKLIDDLTLQFPGIRITSFSWGSGPIVSADSDGNLVAADSNLRTLDLGLELYMYDKGEA